MFAQDFLFVLDFSFDCSKGSILCSNTRLACSIYFFTLFLLLVFSSFQCDKLRKKKTQMFGSFRIAHGSLMDDIDHKIFEAR